MTDRTVSVRLQARVSDYLAGLSAASKATTDLANKVDLAKGRASQSFQTLGHGMLLAGGLIAAGAGYAVHEMAGFESRLSQVKSLSQASESDMRRLHDAALTVGQAYGFTADEVADAEIELTKAGISTADMLGGALKGALTLAAAGQIDVADATEIAAVAMTQFKLAGADVPHIADLLAAGADKALGSVGDLGYGLKAGGLVASQFGVSLEETVGTLSAFAQAGLIGEQGGTVLKQMLIQLASPSKQADTIMKSLGIHAYDTGGKFVGLANLAGQLHNKMAGLSQAERDHALAVIFGSRAIQGANVLYNLSAEGIEKWTGDVNSAGFAALQAAGKMDNLSGDIQKFQSSLKNAFIGAGEDADGPLRTLVQDATLVVDAWNDLPEPIRQGVELLALAGGAALLAGGAFITLVPRIAATKLAMEELGITSSRVGGVLGKGGKLLGGLTVATAAVSIIGGLMHHTSIDADAMSASLQRLGRTGAVQGEITRAFGADLSDLKDVVDHSGDGFQILGLKIHLGLDSFTRSGASFAENRKKIDAVDDALANLVRSGHADDAQAAFKQISDAAEAQGVDLDKLGSKFDDYNGALRASAESADEAGGSVDKFGNRVNASGEALKSAADSAKEYIDALHAVYDPVFGLSDALHSLKEKQRAVNDAVAKYGAHSPQAKRAYLDLAKGALEVDAAASRLKGEIADGNITLDQAVGYLNRWVHQGLLTRAEAEQVAAKFGALFDQAVKLGHLNVNIPVHSDTNQAVSSLQRVKSMLAGIHDKTIRVTTVNTTNHVNGGAGGHILEPQSDRAYGGWVGGNGGPRQDNIRLNASSGEFVVNAESARANASLLEAINSGRRIDVTRAYPRGGDGASAMRPNVTYDVDVHYPEPERASVDLPRVLRDAAIRSGMGWA